LVAIDRKADRLQTLLANVRTDVPDIRTAADTLKQRLEGAGRQRR